MKRLFASVIAGCAMTCAAAQADTTYTVNPAAPWVGFMNVFELPANGGGYVFGSGWGTSDLVATFSGPTLTLAPNSVNDPSTFWYQGGGGPGHPGNKKMDANMYVEQTDVLNGQNVTFQGMVLSNTLTSAHTSVAFIKDFAPDYSSNVSITIPLNPGPFSITLATNPGLGRHVQYGFETIGENVWITDVAPFGNVQVTAVPEPTTAATLAGAAIGSLALRRRRSE